MFSWDVNHGILSSLENNSVAAVVSCYCFIIVAAVIVLGLGGIVFVVCSIVLSKGCKPFMSDLTRAATSPLEKGVQVAIPLVLAVIVAAIFVLTDILWGSNKTESLHWSPLGFGSKFPTSFRDHFTWHESPTYGKK